MGYLRFGPALKPKPPKHGKRGSVAFATPSGTATAL